uniref:Ectonucleoside triphosphate diphosphohydrolase 2 n=1 Tax=Spermophilus dauricus TaxID=99837 RepID=A0A8C9P4I5_SPEDA
MWESETPAAPPLRLFSPGWEGLVLVTSSRPDSLLSQYGIVLDAGSSHTSMFVYKWPADKENDTGIVGQHSSCDVQGGGISSYADNPSGAGQSLVECLEQALRDVPKERHAGTPLYLGATAGMRLLNLTSPEASATVLAAVTRTLTQYPFDFRGARILSGQDEGVFGWVTANYLLENFIKYGWVGRWFRPRKGTLGAMDLGGASTQITFETAIPAEDPANEVQLRLYGQHYRVYTHSFLCYGRDQVLQRLLASALQTHRFHPCWPRGYSTQVLLQDLYQSPCTEAQRPQTFNSSARVSVSGTSDPVLCHDLVSGLFDLSSCTFSRCSFNGVFQPPVAGNFIVSPGRHGWVRCPTALGERAVSWSRNAAPAPQAVARRPSSSPARASGHSGPPPPCAVAQECAVRGVPLWMQPRWGAMGDDGRGPLPAIGWPGQCGWALRLEQGLAGAKGVELG